MRTERIQLWRFILCMLFAVSALAAAARDSAEKNDSSEVRVDDDSTETKSAEDLDDAKDSKEDDSPSIEVADEPYVAQASAEDLRAAAGDNDSKEEVTNENDDDSAEQQNDDGDSKEDASADEQVVDNDSNEDNTKEDDSNDSNETQDRDDDSGEDKKTESDNDDSAEDGQDTAEDNKSNEADDGSVENNKDDDKTDEDDGSQEKAESNEENDSGKSNESQEDKDGSKEDNQESEEDKNASGEDDKESQEKISGENDDSGEDDKSAEADNDKDDDKSGETDGKDNAADDGESNESGKGDDVSDEADESDGDNSDEDEGTPEEDLLKTADIPDNLRSREHINQILRLDEEASEDEITIERSADIVLRDLKRLYENSIKPLEALYKYRDLSNRHFGDPEIFSKPLVLFMGPWSGGKSSILNYLTGLEFTEWSLRTGAEPSPAYFNILMHGKDPEVLDGTQLAADWTFSGLQKFGQGLEERLRGLKYPSKILEKVNIVEIPGILEVRKQVSRVFPFNDACQWFIDRADIIFLVYDPSKLDVGPETEAILDQLKGRESQTRIVLNKADTVKPEELMRVQSALIWNISPLMSSAQPPVMYTVSLWSLPFEPGAPIRLLQAQERELLRDLRYAIDKRIENKIASARRFAVRVRNHAKMVDCYLTTYYNHKTIFGNKKLIADAIIENPQNYHIYEGLSTLTNISRYDLPDPETYRDFFRLNPVYEFQQLSATCTYFRGCPITRLDVAIAYDLPELVGKYKKMVETATPQGMPKS
ncbi:hypothetical protein ACJJTC_011571 [Scirpophaga incertulas]